ncbi:MAG: hypothetical protein J6Z36_00095, partial [Clostridia bacterium]|nr:hypothetical protein [Clostridia bacterium]
MVEFFNFVNETSYVAAVFEWENSFLWISLVAGVLFLTVFSFQAIGLYTAAKRANNKHAWFAFVPFLNDYLLGSLAGDGTFFNFRMKRSGLFLAIFDFICSAGYAFILVLQVLLQDYLVPIESSSTYNYIGPDSLKWA